MALNVLLMYVFASTPLAVIMGGELIAERGVENGETGLVLAGVAILEVAFDAGILAFLPPATQLTALGITAVVTATMTFLIGASVYARGGTTFDYYNTWATYAFLGGLGGVLVGRFFPPVLLVGFVLIFLGFLFGLGWEIWRIRDGRISSPSLQAIGLYVAVAAGDRPLRRRRWGVRPRPPVIVTIATVCTPIAPSSCDRVCNDLQWLL